MGTGELTTRECVEAVIRAVYRYCERGACNNCAISLTAGDYNIERFKVEDLWLDRQLRLFES